MPDRLTEFMAWINSLPAPAHAFIMAAIVAPLRVMYDDRKAKWSRIVLESVLCGSLSVGLCGVTEWLGIPQSIAVFIGSSVGFLGVVQVREIAMKIIGKKMGE